MSRTPREQIIADNPLLVFCQKRGMEFRRQGAEQYALCPLHRDGSPSFRVNEAKGSWYCDPCGKGGSVIDLVVALDGCTVGEAMRKLAGDEGQPIPRSPGAARRAAPGEPLGDPVATYSYRDANGRECYQVRRFKPKTFRQFSPDGRGGWRPSMDGVERVLYRLPEVLAAEGPIFVVEGEKDADTIARIGWPVTCNVGGAGKWLDAYSESLRGKEVVICPDNDAAGASHADLVAKSLSGFAKTVRRIRVPDPHKDVSDWMAADPQAPTRLIELAERAPVLVMGEELPIWSSARAIDAYRESVRRSAEFTLDLGRWLPALSHLTRPLRPGDLVTVIASTGGGKTACLQNLALAAAPLPTIFFELELSKEDAIERFLQITCNRTGAEVEKSFVHSDGVDPAGRLDHLHIFEAPGLTPELIRRYVARSELVIGSKPRLVFLDYIQLMRGSGGARSDRYDRVSEGAEELKIIAKELGVIVVMASQAARKPPGASPEIFASDAKESGSIENSSGLVLGAWKDPDSPGELLVKVCKSTRGVSGGRVRCRFDGATMRVTQHANQSF